ncbi:hypothetical protein LIER_10930 [Lithospermum erythrorhizon]|uniref:Reverse transcriptase domain-containing protein n=1 Tax=Lithospermum erythrorhizon TaxID=34254 RepID=A0AAV3PL43_LITER
MVSKVFSTQIGRNMEIYVDDMLIKSREVADHEANLRESFENLQKYNMRLNPDNPQTQKGVHRLTGRIAALTRSISRFGDRSLPFFRAIKKGENLNGLRSVRNPFRN